ncbi:hypothetical protein [Streptosporangium roseum]|uniref:hypothetical protein n=1 Tax=Streptosporangium roseum TaxID=2001 RepID=UPI0011D1A336|nr:hypothetical protein [Streptosporangium roseum]
MNDPFQQMERNDFDPGTVFAPACFAGSVSLAQLADGGTAGELAQEIRQCVGLLRLTLQTSLWTPWTAHALAPLIDRGKMHCPLFRRSYRRDC